MCVCAVYVHVLSLEGQSERKREKNTGEAKERRKERDRSRASGLPGFRQEDVTVNPRPPASDEPTLSLARPATQPSSSTSSSARAYVLRLHMHIHAGRGRRVARGTPIHVGLYRRIITERIVIAFFAMVRNGPVAPDGPASLRPGSLRRGERQG